jgi:hypothetical protein
MSRSIARRAGMARHAAVRSHQVAILGGPFMVMTRLSGQTLAVCSENLSRVDEVRESPKVAE